MRIGEIAKRTGLNISNIRFYERKGLLAPKREQDSQYRDYTEEDVLQVKTILLYRKMGIPIETVYLLLHGQADLKEVLFRQQLALQEEIENLNGSLQLCQMLLQEEHPKLEGAQIETYLNYVHEEEEKNVRFACISELMEDMSAYTNHSGIGCINIKGGRFYSPFSSGELRSYVRLCILSKLPVGKQH